MRRMMNGFLKLLYWQFFLCQPYPGIRSKHPPIQKPTVPIARGSPKGLVLRESKSVAASRRTPAWSRGCIWDRWPCVSRMARVRNALAGQPRGHRMNIRIAKSLRNLCHAVRCMGFSLTSLPAPELRIEIVSWQADKPRREGCNTRKRHPMALNASRNLQRLIAALGYGFATHHQRSCGGCYCGRRVGDIKL